MAKVVRLWVREDGEEPKAMPRGARSAPGPGRIVDVQARSASDARKTLALLAAPAPDEDKDPDGWLARRQAAKRVTEVIRGPG